MAGQIRRLSETSLMADGACRLLVTAGPPNGAPSLLIQIDQRTFPQRPLRVITYRGVRVRAQLKAMTVMQSYLAQRAATAAGADDAILVDDEGRIFEGATSNMFIVRGGGLVTPPAEGAILPGVLRAKVEQLAEAHGVTVVEAFARVADLRPDDGMLLTSSVRGIVPVACVDDRELRVDGELTAQLRSLVGEAEAGERSRLPRRVPLAGSRAPPPAFQVYSQPSAATDGHASWTGHHHRRDLPGGLRLRRVAAALSVDHAQRRCGEHAQLRHGDHAGAAAPDLDRARRARARPGAPEDRRLLLAARLRGAAPAGDASRLFIVEKTGRIRIVKDGTLLAQPFSDIHTQVSNGSEQGLLSMAFDPKYATNRRFYIDFTNTAGDTRIVRYQASASDPDRADTSTLHVLLRIAQPYSNHNGGQLQFGPDGRLYVGMGDGGSGGDPRQQRPEQRQPCSARSCASTLGTSPLKIATYTKGMRNPWRFSFDRANGNLWIGDVGQNAWEEIDRLSAGRPAGANLGWSGYEGTHLYNSARAARMDKSKLVWPVNQYSHSVGYAVIGGYVYRGSAIPALRGYYLFADEVSGRVWMMKGAAGSRVRAPGLDGNVPHPSSFGQDAAGELYIVSLDGAVYKIIGG